MGMLVEELFRVPVRSDPLLLRREAEYAMLNPARLWTGFALDQRQRFQRVLFPDGLDFADGAFRTPRMFIVFSYLRGIGAAESGLASPAGFEPALPT